jgi:hypothetical protein
MRIVLKPWFSVVVLLVAIAVWAFTIGDWGPWHVQTAASSRLQLRGDTFTRQTVTSPPFSLSGGPATLRVSASPATSAASSGQTLIVDAQWSLLPASPRKTGAMGGDEGLLSPTLDTGPMSLAGIEDGSNPRGGFRMRVSASSNANATITATVTELRGYWHGIPVFWIILAAGVAYIGLNVILLRRQYPPNSIVVPQRHEHE